MMKCRFCYTRPITKIPREGRSTGILTAFSKERCAKCARGQGWRIATLKGRKVWVHKEKKSEVIEV